MMFFIIVSDFDVLENVDRNFDKEFMVINFRESCIYFFLGG